MASSTDLRILFDSSFPLVLAETRDEERLLELIRSKAARQTTPVWMWSAASGLARDGHGPQYGTRDPATALAFVAETTGPGVFVFADAHPALGDPVVMRGLKEAAQTAGPNRTIVLTGPQNDIPPELEGVAVAWQHQPPGEDELAELVSDTIRHLVARGVAVNLDEAGERALAASLKGTTLAEAERLIQSAVLDNRLDTEDVGFVQREKFAGLGDGVLELIQSERRTLDDVGGLDGLKKWLRLRGATVGSTRADDLGLGSPRGVLLTGVPGCGKSMIAKTLAATWDVPLLLLDPGRLYRKYVGESEQRLESALQTAAAMAPTVLWIDEVEKGFASGGDGDGGVSTRILGTFLRWLQDRPDGVFVVATANDVASLPPELLRKGRFDEIFFVDLPGADARRAIFAGQLEGRGHDPADFDLDKLAEVTEDFSGAEIEAIVVGALYRVFAAGGPPTTEELIAEAEDTIPLSVSRAEDVAALRRWAEGRAVAA